MALSDILQKIRDEAEQEARDIHQKAEKRHAEILSSAQEKATAIEAASEEEAVVRQATMDRKVHAHVEMERKIKEVALKNQFMAIVRKKALERLNALPEKTKVSMLQKLLKEIDDKGVIHPAKGQKKLLEEALKGSEKNFEIGSEADISGGFLFVGKKMDVDGSFETLLEKEIIQQREVELSNILFSGK